MKHPKLLILMSFMFFTNVNLQLYPIVDDALKAPTTHDWTSASIAVQNIANITSRFLLTFDLLFCPFSELCSVPQRVYESPNRYLRSCCKQCSCNPRNCLETSNCCPDVKLTKQNSKTDCFSPQYLPYGMTPLNSEHQYKTIIACDPTFPDEDIVNLCENNEKIPKQIDIATPVVSGNMVYKNRFCAVCNYINETSIQPFSGQIRCLDESGIFAYSIEDLLDRVRKEKNCNIIFVKPRTLLFSAQSNDISLNLKCEKAFISQCNVTGQWKVYNSTIEKACLSYTHVYLSYRNVFCYLCNNNDYPFTACDKNDIEGNEEFQFGSFTAMLRFSDYKYSKSVDMERKCQGQSEYNAFKKTCVDVFCSTPFYYYNNSCVKIYEDKMRYYEIFLQTNTNLSQIQESSILSYLSSKTCRINKFRKPLMNSTTNDGIIYHVIFEGTDNAKYMNDILDVESLDVKILTGILYSDVDDISNYIDPINGERLVPITSLSTILGRNCRIPDKITRISRLLLCPYVLVKQNEVVLGMNKYELCFPELNSCFSQLEFRKINSSHYAVCSKTIFNKTDGGISNDLKFKHEYDETKGILSVVCTCVSAASLLFTIFTYLFFKSLRTLPGKITLSLCISLLLAHVLHTFGLHQIHNPDICTILGAMIHFSWLCAIFWMNASCVNMFRVFVITAPTTTSTKERKVLFLKYAAYVFLLAVVFLSINIGISLAKGEGVGYGGHICFIKNRLMILFTFAIPLAIVIVSNIVLYLLVVIRISRLPNLKHCTTKDRNNFIIFIKLSTITGVSWIFGFIDAWLDLEVLEYIFIVLAGFQGVYLMLAFSCSERVRELYRAKATPVRSTSYTVSSKTTHPIQLSTSNPQIYVKAT